MTILTVEWNLETAACLIVGYGVSLGIGHLVIWPLLTAIFRKISDTTQLSTARYAAAVGLAERAIYTTVVLSEGIEAVGGWLILKAILEFKSSKRSMESYYAYLLGNALSLLFGLLGGLLILVLWKQLL